MKPCTFFHFGLIVTGEGERNHLPLLFRELAASGYCHFEVIRKIDQRSPITSKKRRLKVVGSKGLVPTRDAEQIGLPSRKYLDEKPCSLVLLIDDLEYKRRDKAPAIFDRYRKALDSVLNDSQKRRVAVHFLVNMLEAYFFAHPQAVNDVLDCSPPLEECKDDVEKMRHPKGELKRRCKNYSETKTIAQILSRLDVPHILSRLDACASLRTMFVWCVCKMEEYAEPSSFIYITKLRNHFHLDDGVLHPITSHQCDEQSSYDEP